MKISSVVTLFGLLVWCPSVMCNSANNDYSLYPTAELATKVLGEAPKYSGESFLENLIGDRDIILKANTVYEISEEYDLKGKTLDVPSNCTFIFTGGKFKNGTLKGTATYIDAQLIQIFDNVKLTGNWKNRDFLAYWFGVRGDGLTDDSKSLNYAISAIPVGTTLKYIGDNILIEKEVIINKNVNLAFDAVVFLKKKGGLKFDGTKDCRYQIKKIVGEGRSSNIIALNLVNCKFCQFDVDVIESCLYGISFNKDNRNYEEAPLGQNIFRFVRIMNCNKGIVFWGDKQWKGNKIVWAEGNEFWGGFVVKCDTGVELQDNIKCGNTIFMGAIDCAEIANSYDVVDRTNTSHYAQKNVYILNFVRFSASIMRERDSYVSTESGIQSHMRGLFNDGVHAGSGDNMVKVLPGSIEMSSPNGSFIDLKTENRKDRDGRIYVTDEAMTLSKYNGSSISITDVVKIKDSGIISIPSGKRGIFHVEFPQSKKTDNYMVILTPTWESVTYLKSKTKSGFDVEVSTAPNANSSVFWVVLGLD